MRTFISLILFSFLFIFTSYANAASDEQLNYGVKKDGRKISYQPDANFIETKKMVLLKWQWDCHPEQSEGLINNKSLLNILGKDWNSPINIDV